MGSGARVKGYIKNRDTGRVMPFLYNPETFSDSTGTTFNEISSPGSSYPKFQYVKGEARSISVDLFLYSNTGKVRDYLDFLEGFRPARNNKFSPPPVLIFAFGSYVHSCVLEKLDRSFNDWDSNLNIKHAVVSLTLKVV